MSNLISATLTLTRWHVVADQVRALGMAQQKEAQSVLDETRLQHAPSEEQKAALKQRGAKALEQIKSAQVNLGIFSQIRASLAKANAEAGVSELLARIEGLRMQMRLANVFANIDLLTKVNLDNVGEVLKSSSEAESSRSRSLYGHGPSGVSVCLVDINALDDFRVEQKRLEAEIAAHSNRLSDLNRKTLTLPLPEDVARSCGITGNG